MRTPIRQENNNKQWFHMKYPTANIYSVTEIRQTLVMKNKRYRL